MYERTISLFSAGKTFAATGWRVGYSIAPPHLSKPLLTAHAAVNFCGAIPLELGVAGAFRQAMQSNYFEVGLLWRGSHVRRDDTGRCSPKAPLCCSIPSQELRTMMQQKRDVLVSAMRDSGIAPVVPEGGFFIMGDSSLLPIAPEEDDSDLTSMCQGAAMVGISLLDCEHSQSCNPAATSWQLLCENFPKLTIAIHW